MDEYQPKHNLNESKAPEDTHNETRAVPIESKVIWEWQ